MSTLRYTQFQTVSNPEFRAIVEAAMMVQAYQVRNGDRTDPDYEQRNGLATSLLSAETETHVRAGYVTIFSWWAVNHPDVIAAYTAAGGDPKLIPDAVIDTVVGEFWDIAANVHPEGEQEG